jgi:uncharacterized damage-inducible protein DinB
MPSPFRYLNVLLPVIAILWLSPLYGQAAFLTEIQQKWANAGDYTREVALLLPAEQYGFQPTPDQMSFGAQLGHLASNILWLSSAYLGGPQAAPKAAELPTDKDSLLQLLETALQQGARVLAQIQPEALEEKVDFFAGNFSRRQIIHLMQDHLTHHRAQMIVYLRLQGITPPKYRGW